jgi:hypothetical protein
MQKTLYTIFQLTAGLLLFSAANAAQINITNDDLYSRGKVVFLIPA